MNQMRRMKLRRRIFKINMDYSRKSKTIYLVINNIIMIKKTKYYNKKSVSNVKIMSIVEYRKYKNEKNIYKNTKYKKNI